MCPRFNRRQHGAGVVVAAGVDGTCVSCLLGILYISTYAHTGDIVDIWKLYVVTLSIWHREYTHLN